MRSNSVNLKTIFCRLPRRWTQTCFQQHRFRFLVLGITSALITAIPATAAERLYFTYGAINLSVGVDSLETFAKDGTINKELEFYLSRFSPSLIQSLK
ncbi:MAG: alpha/beta hydrolase, partial [Microcystaceae cyanobacterium]